MLRRRRVLVPYHARGHPGRSHHLSVRRAAGEPSFQAAPVGPESRLRPSEQWSTASVASRQP